MEYEKKLYYSITYLQPNRTDSIKSVNCFLVVHAVAVSRIAPIRLRMTMKSIAPKKEKAEGEQMAIHWIYWGHLSLGLRGPVEIMYITCIYYV